jgi:hypothetical protein
MNMRLVLTKTLFVALILASCTPGDSQSVIPTPTAPARIATVSEIENDIQTRNVDEEKYTDVTEGQQLLIGGQARSGEDSRARLDLEPDGTIVRLGPTTEFTLAELNDQPDDPFTKITLAAGRLWIILNGGSLDVETDVGTASVRGSMMGVFYDPVLQTMTATCLVGHCSLKNDAGKTDMTGGQASDIPGAGKPPSPPRDINDDEYNDWKKNGPGPEGGYENSPSTFKYELVNQCSVAKHFVLSGPNGSAEHVVDPGQSVSGELPPGDYSLVFWDEGNPETKIDPPIELHGDNSKTITCSNQNPVPSAQEMIHFVFHNQCSTDTYFYNVSGVGGSLELTAGPGETVEGDLPRMPGETYTLTYGSLGTDNPVVSTFNAGDYKVEYFTGCP